MGEDGNEQQGNPVPKTEHLGWQEGAEPQLPDRLTFEMATDLPEEEKRQAVYIAGAVLGLEERQAEYVSHSKMPRMKTIFRALLEGIPLNWLEGIDVKGETEKTFRAAVLKESCRRFANIEPVMEQVRELQGEVRKVVEDYDYTKNEYLAELLATGRKERETQDKIIGMQEKKIQELGEQCQRLKTELARFENLPAPVVPTVGTAEKKSRCRKWGWLWIGRKKQDEMEVFIGRYLDSGEYSQEQKEFFLNCMEEGLSVAEIEKFAAPGLSTEQMRRLKDIFRRNQKSQNTRERAYSTENREEQERGKR